MRYRTLAVAAVLTITTLSMLFAQPPADQPATSPPGSTPTPGSAAGSTDNGAGPGAPNTPSAPGSTTPSSTAPASNQPAVPEATPPGGQPPTPPQPGLGNAPINNQPAFYVHAELGQPKKDYREGEELSIKVTCEVDAYLYVLYQPAEGKVYQIYPNKAQKNNRVAAKQQVSVPGNDDLFRWVVEAPFGKEVIKVLACRVPVDDLSSTQNRSKRFNPISSATLRGAQEQLAKGNPADWAEVDLELLTYARGTGPNNTGAKRFGVFFGISQHQFNEEHKAAFAEANKKGGLNLRAADKDALTLSKAMGEIGELNDMRVYTNLDATRAAIENAITRWLPSVSRPGDTVFIHFSGHGSQIRDDNGDESDQMDEVLIPSDVIDTAILSQLVKQEGQLDPAVAQRVPQLLEIARRDPDHAWDELMRTTAISDDVFGRWLQKLQGRQVVVLIDSCHSGGFSIQEKGAAADKGEFTFLEGEMARLKDIGERDQAMLSAALRAEKALELMSGDNGVLTGFLIESLRVTSGPVRLEDGYRYCEENFPKYFQLVNQKLEAEGYKERLEPHHPLLVNYCNRPVFLKP